LVSRFWFLVIIFKTSHTRAEVPPEADAPWAQNRPVQPRGEKDRKTKIKILKIGLLLKVSQNA
jgi:hypothetical protein